jgi:outer membrane lipoprotein SlyB
MIRRFQSPPLLALLCAALAIVATSCTTTRNHPPIVKQSIVKPQSKLGRVTHITTDFTRRAGDTDHASWGILQGGLLGSMIGRGGAANAAGAVGGMIVGGLLGNSRDNKAADTIYRIVEVKVSDGETVVVRQRYDKKSPVVKVGDRVVVETDGRGTPSRVFPVSGGSNW